MTKKEYVLLYEKYIAGNCNSEEKQLFESYQDDFSLDIDGELAPHIKDQITKMLEISMRRQKTKRLYFYRFSWVAAALIVITTAVYFYLSPMPVPVKKQELVGGKPLPIDNGKAILTLDDGSQIMLDHIDNGVLANQGGVTVRKEKGSELIYDVAKKDDSNFSVKYNSISIPFGSEYRLVLPDGSKVWLNAVSSIRFPVVFNGTERRVEISGEAYFEVIKDTSKPFRVIANGTEIEVLGTHFNVNAYSSNVNTTLLSGSVKLKTSKKEALLKPGQSGLSQSNGSFKVFEADIEAAIAWKEGFFVFHDESVKQIMEKISRWYNVDVNYVGDAGNKLFYGKISRSYQLEELLKNIEITGLVHFKIEGRRVTVMP